MSQIYYILFGNKQIYYTLHTFFKLNKNALEIDFKIFTEKTRKLDLPKIQNYKLDNIMRKNSKMLINVLTRTIAVKFYVFLIT